MTATEGGVVLYLRQEGRGIGLINKLKAYQLHVAGLNTGEANVHLGFPEDARTYNEAILILKDLGIEKIRLLTNNPLKLDAFEGSDIAIVERVPLIIEPNDDNHFYLKTKQDLMGHLFQL